MAAAPDNTKRNVHSPGFFCKLNALSTADFCLPSKRKRKTLEGGRLYSVERVIASRTSKEGKEFLVKWLGYSSFESTWEPQEHLTEECIRYFNEPTPSKNVTLVEVSRLRVAIHESLNSPQTRSRVTVEFRQDVFSFLFMGKGLKLGLWLVLEKENFEETFFSNNWDNLLDCHGQGTKLHFPVKVRHFISWSPAHHIVDTSGNVVPSPRSYLEKMSMDFIKVAA